MSTYRQPQVYSKNPNGPKRDAYTYYAYEVGVITYLMFFEFREAGGFTRSWAVYG
jgi:hypothetical protein